MASSALLFCREKQLQLNPMFFFSSAVSSFSTKQTMVMDHLWAVSFFTVFVQQTSYNNTLALCVWLKKLWNFKVDFRQQSWAQKSPSPAKSALNACSCQYWVPDRRPCAVSQAVPYNLLAAHESFSSSSATIWSISFIFLNYIIALHPQFYNIEIGCYNLS